MRGADLLSSTHASYTCKNNSFNFVPHRTKTHESANLNICKYFVPNCKLISAFPERRLSLAQEGVKTNLWLYVQNWSPITTEFRKYVTNTDNNISGEKQSGRRNYEVSISPPPRHRLWFDPTTPERHTLNTLSLSFLTSLHKENIQY